MRSNCLWAVFAVMLFHSCATQTPPVQNINTQSREMNSYQQSLEPKQAKYSRNSIQNPTGTITIGQAASLALLQNPGLSTYPYEIRAQEALALQAGLLPNPELEAEFEDFAGTGDFDFGDRVEATTFYSQLIERGGKREKRYQLGLWETEMARWDYRTAKVDVLTLLAQRYLDVLAEQERVSILEELVQLGEKALYAISERVRTGRVSPMQETRAKVELASEQNSLDVARQDLKASKTMLASAWGSTKAAFDKVSGNLDGIQALPEQEKLISQVENNPDILRWASEHQRRKTVLELEQAQAVPDITLTGGIRYLNESEDASIIGAFSIPLQLYDRNQGAIEAAQERLQKAEVERAAVLTEVQSTLSSLYQRLQGTKRSIERLQSEIIPGAEQAYHAAQEGYRQGKFDYLSVLDSQRTLFQSRVQYVEALAQFHKQWIALERLIGQPLQEEITQVSKEVKP